AGEAAEPVQGRSRVGGDGEGWRRERHGEEEEFHSVSLRTRAAREPQLQISVFHGGTGGFTESLLDPRLMARGHHHPLLAVHRELLAELDGIRRTPGVDNAEVGGLAVLGAVPGEGPYGALDDERAGMHG